MKNRRNLPLVLVLWAVAATPVWAGTISTAVGGAGEGLGTQTLHQQIASPENGYFSPRAQFNGAGATVTNPVGGYGSNGFMSPSGQSMSSPQGGAAPSGMNGTP
jgi:hypothetical protein